MTDWLAKLCGIVALTFMLWGAVMTMIFTYWR